MDCNDKDVNRVCDFCEDNIYFDAIDYSWKMRIENNTWNERIDGYDYQDVEINYCCVCGKKYQDEKL